MKKLFKKLTLMVVALLTFSVGSNYTVKEVKAADEVVFELGANGSASHNDGSEKTTYSESDSGYTLSLAGGSKMYTGARDAMGNSCIKLGTSSVAGSFKFNVSSDVTSVIIAVGKYKDKTSKVKINNTSYTLANASNNGAYDDITVDTSVTKTVNFTTVSGGYRCMINTIKFVLSSESIDPEQEKFDTIATYETNYSLSFNYSLAYSKQTVDEVDVERTLSFDDAKYRIESTKSNQVWSNNGVKVEYNKGSYTNDLAEFSNPLRVYKGTEIIISGPNKISKIAIDVTNIENKYVTPIESSVSNCEYKLESGVITLTLESLVESYTINASAQIRFNSITITCNGTGTIEVLDNQSYSDVSILFGAEVDASLFEGYTVSGGVLIDNAANYTNTTIAEVYRNGNFKGLTTENASLSKVKNQKEEEIYSVGTVVEIIDGLVTEDNVINLDYKFVAAVYFTLTNEEDSKTIVLQQKSYSAREMLNYYIENLSTLGITNPDTIKALGAFSTYIG